jgi:hypothetical protein
MADRASVNARAESYALVVHAGSRIQQAAILRATVRVIALIAAEQRYALLSSSHRWQPSRVPSARTLPPVIVSSHDG